MEKFLQVFCYDEIFKMDLIRGQKLFTVLDELNNGEVEVNFLIFSVDGEDALFNQPEFMDVNDVRKSLFLYCNEKNVKAEDVWKQVDSRDRKTMNSSQFREFLGVFGLKGLTEDNFSH
jgi:Ca2+-binding EF-hand superfamily protein